MSYTILKYDSIIAFAVVERPWVSADRSTEAKMNATIIGNKALFEKLIKKYL